MPINKHLMANLIKKYGARKAQDVYYGMLEQAKQGKRSKGMFPGELGGKKKKKSKKSW
jgi:hypothetical protein